MWYQLEATKCPLTAEKTSTCQTMHTGILHSNTSVDADGESHRPMIVSSVPPNFLLRPLLFLSANLTTSHLPHLCHRPHSWQKESQECPPPLGFIPPTPPPLIQPSPQPLPLGPCRLTGELSHGPAPGPMPISSDVQAACGYTCLEPLQQVPTGFLPLRRTSPFWQLPRLSGRDSQEKGSKTGGEQPAPPQQKAEGRDRCRWQNVRDRLLFSGSHTARWEVPLQTRRGTLHPDLRS